ncbi:hypothetical protein EON65_11530, partial [archaeon]
MSPEKDPESLAKARLHAWRLSNNQILDPTTSTGQLHRRIQFLLGIRSVPTMMSHVSSAPADNSKGSGGKGNVYVQEEGSRVWFLAKRDIHAGGEHDHTVYICNIFMNIYKSFPTYLLEELFVKDARYLALNGDVKKVASSSMVEGGGIDVVE